MRPVRRFVGMGLDMLVLSLGLLIGQGTAALFYPFYLWITLGMGFRYGRSYLLVSAVSSLLSFALVIAMTEYWRAQLALAAGLWLALLLLPAYALSLLTKLTDALTRAEEASHAKSRFLATMSHELRTPLHAIIGMADLLRASVLRAEQQEMVRTLRSAGQTLLEMIGDLLDVAKIESGTMTVQPVAFDLHALLATVRTLLHHQARDKGLELRLTLDPTVPYHLHGAARSLQQILVNLVANAIKFTDVGHVGVRVFAEAIEPDKVMLRIEVHDTGIGIPLGVQEHIFERFAQVDESATRRHGGTGLGLAIARQLANLMGGFLVVDSTPGVGSCFTFRAPFGRSDRAEQRLSGSVVVVGEPAHTASYLERVAAWGATAEGASRPDQVKEVMARGGRPPALLFIDSQEWPLDLAALEDCIAAAQTDPPSVVLVTSREQNDHARYLAVLPSEVDDASLFAALHAALAQPDVPLPMSLPDAASRPALSVLVAEDNRINQQVIERMLRSAGHTVTLVDDGGQALDALETGSFDIVLIDVNMPVMNGLDVVKLHRFATDAGELDTLHCPHRRCYRGDPACVRGGRDGCVPHQTCRHGAAAHPDRSRGASGSSGDVVAALEPHAACRDRHPARAGSRHHAPGPATAAGRSRRFPRRPDPRLHRRRRAVGGGARSCGAALRRRSFSRSGPCLAQQRRTSGRHRAVRAVPAVARHRGRRTGGRRQRVRDASQVGVRTIARCPPAGAGPTGSARGDRSQPTALRRRAGAGRVRAWRRS